MQSVVKRVGFFTREITSPGNKGGSSKYMIRYFLIDNSANIYYTEHYTQLVHLIRKSSCLRALFALADEQLKKFRFSDIKVQKEKKTEHPENLPFLNRNYFEVEITSGALPHDQSTLGSSKVDEVRKFAFFSFREPHLLLMNRFLSEYEAQAKADTKETEPFDWIGSEETQDDKGPSKQVAAKLAGLAEQAAKVASIMEELKTHEAQSERQEEGRGPATGEEGEKGETAAGPSQTTKGRLNFSDHLFYSGELLNGKMHGSGYFVLGEKGMCYVESINGQICGI